MLTENSGNKLLGYGQFAIVLKGRIVSQSLPAAIKISKPSNDVEIFKSLLSEIKIMMYVGSHVNILKLLGVCTSGIKRRKSQATTN